MDNTSSPDEENVGDASLGTCRPTFHKDGSSKNPIACDEEDDDGRSRHKDHSDKAKKHASETPKIGMEFQTEQGAYDFYNEYAGKVGFGIRREWGHSKGGICTRRKFCCSKGGQPKPDKRRTNVKNPRGTGKVDCKAIMIISLRPNGKYAIVQFEGEHNHHLEPTKAYMFRSRKKMSVAQAEKGHIADNIGSSSKATFDFMSVHTGGHENVNFLPVGHKNYLQTRRMRSMEVGEAGSVLEYLQTMIVEDPGSVYAIQLDIEDKITNVFWADSRMLADYIAFGDVVCFDTTYRTNNYARPFALFIGVNHHKQIVVFGAALMYDETAESFEWLFRAFLKAMTGNQPQTILTEQDKAIAKAIPKALPNSYHRICVWHVYHNARKHIGHVFSGSKSFNEDFCKCIFDYDNEADFLDAWEHMLDKYQLRENGWLQQLFDERENWALVYERHTFCADMKSMQQTESMNSVLKKYLHHTHDLLQFFPRFEELVAERRNSEAKADFRMTQSIPNLTLPVPILKSARDVYTPEIFKLFQEEYGKGMGCIYKLFHQVETVNTYKVVWTEDKNREYIVIFDTIDHTVSCSCKKFEFVGILCGHALRIIDHACLQAVPDKYILIRWRKDAKDQIVINTRVAATSEERQKLPQRYNELMRASMKLNSMASENSHAYALALKILNEGCISVAQFLNQSPLGSPPTISSKNKVVDTCDNGDSLEVQGDGCRTRHRTESGLEQNARKRRLIPTTEMTTTCEQMRQPISIHQTEHAMQGMYPIGLNPLVYHQPRGHQMNQFVYQQPQSLQELSFIGTQQLQHHFSMPSGSQEGNQEKGDQIHVQNS